MTDSNGFTDALVFAGNREVRNSDDVYRLNVNGIDRKMFCEYKWQSDISNTYTSHVYDLYFSIQVLAICIIYFFYFEMLITNKLCK